MLLLHNIIPNTMRMDGAGLVEKHVFAKTLRMLAEAYKCLKNVAFDCHPHCRILENGLRMLRTPTNVVTNNANALQTPYELSDCVANACRIVFICHLFACKNSKQYQCKSKSPAMPRGMEKIISLLIKVYSLKTHHFAVSRKLRFT